MMSEDPQIMTWLAKFIYYGFSKRNDIHWEAYVGSLHHSICWLCYIYEFLHVVLCTALFVKFFLHVNSRNMCLIGMWRFAVVFLHMYLWCVLCSFYCFILWLLCQKLRNKREYIYVYIYVCVCFWLGHTRKLFYRMELGYCGELAWVTAGQTPFNSSPAYMHQWIVSALLHIMACRLYGGKPLS